MSSRSVILAQRTAAVDLSVAWAGSSASSLPVSAPRRLYLVLGDAHAGKSTLMKEFGCQAAPSWRRFRGAWRRNDMILLERRWGELPSRWQMRADLMAGIILVLPLDMSSPEVCFEKIFSWTEALSRRLGRLVPIYVVFTGCDTLPGFTDLWTLAPPGRRDQSFAWCADDGGAGLQGAVVRLRHRLEELELDILSVGPCAAVAQRVVQFSTTFTVAAERFAVAFDGITAAGHAGLWLRGVTLAGRSPSAPGGADAALCLDFFNRQVEPDRSLFAPPSSWRRRALPASLTMLALVASGALWYGAVQVTHDLASLRAATESVTIPVDDTTAHPAALAALVERGDRLRALAETSVWFPTSYWRPLEPLIDRYLAGEVDQFVAHPMRRRLAARLDLAGNARQPSSAVKDGIAAFVATVDRVLAAEHILDLSRRPAELPALWQALSGKPIPQAILREPYRGYLVAALAAAPIDTERFDIEARRQVRTVARKLFGRAPLERRLARTVRRVVSDLDTLATTHEPAATLSALRQLLDDIEALDMDVSAYRQAGSSTPGDQGAGDAAIQRIAASIALGPAFADEIDAMRRARAVRIHDEIFTVKARGLGPLLQEHAGGRLTLAPALAEMRTALAALLRQPFMRPFDSAPRETTLQDPHLAWSLPVVRDAVRAATEGKRFLLAQAARYPAELVPKILKLGEARLAAAFVGQLSAAQAPSFAVGGSASADRRPDGAVTLDAAYFDEVRTIEAALRTLELDEALQAFQRATGRQAHGALMQLDAALEKANLYAVRGTSPVAVGPALIGLRGSDEIAKYLAGQRQALLALLQRARPLVEYLGRASLPPEIAASDTLRRWVMLDRALDGKPVGWTALERFIAVRLARADGGCGDDDMVTFEEDWFTRRLDGLRHELDAHCQMRADPAALASRYRHVARLFLNSLAGRYPFGGAVADSSRDVDPATLRRFFAATAADLRVLKAGTALPPEVRAFIDELHQARRFFGPWLDGAGAVVDADFGSPTAFDLGTNRLAGVRLRLGASELASGYGRSKAFWRYGQPVVLRLEWATQSPSLPIPGTNGAEWRDQGGVTVTFEGGWALLRLLRQYGSIRAPFVVRLNVPTRSRSNPQAAEELASIIIRIAPRAAAVEMEHLPRFPRRPPPFRS